jgi:NAD(P)-dependent dehydrogenase (short-subunit alcohol dehydrogenase family)
MSLSNKHLIVTGGAGTLGTAVVKLLIDSGAICSVPCFNKAEEDNFELNEHSSVYTEAGIDLSDEQQAQSFYKKAVDAQGPLWGSIHIAGGFGMGSIENTPQSDFEKQLQLNTITCFNSCRTAVEWMRKSDFNGGRIVNIAARPALEPRQGKGMGAYTVSKAGVASLTEALGAELVDENILVNAIAPSIIDTPQNRNSMPNADYEQWPKPEQLAQQITYLVSPENEVTRGGVIPVYGKS